MAQAARLSQTPSGPAIPPSPPRPAQLRARAALAPVNVRISQGEATIRPASAPAPPPAANADRVALATMLGVRLQHIEATLRQPEPAGELSGSQRAELERQQEAIKRALALAEQATQPPMVVDATLRQLLGPLAAVLSPAESGVDHLA